METSDTVEAIERGTLAAVPPQRQQEWAGWLLALDDGTVGRAHSAAPLRHATPSEDTIEEIERRYAQAGRKTVLRLPDVEAFDAMREALHARGYRRSKPTLVQTGTVAAMTHAVRPAPPAEIVLADAPTQEWEQVFLGEGFDPVDGVSRLAILRRGRDSVFASTREGGRTVAVGSACFSGGWCGVHGMRTLATHRGRGLAGALLATLGGAARERGVVHSFLQVDEGNAVARSLYAGRGFRTAWRYVYWHQP